MRATRRRLALLGLLLCSAAPAGAHVPQLRGRLIDLVSQSDLIIVGTVERSQPVDARRSDTQVRVESRLVGDGSDALLTFRTERRFASGTRYVFFLRRAPGSLTCLQPSGAVFAARPADDDAYETTIIAIQRALRGGAAERNPALRAAVIGALSAPPAALRYQAVLELDALGHDGLSDAERQALQRVLADPAADPAIRPIVANLLDATPTQQASGGR